MLPLSLWLYKTQRGLLFSQHLHMLMLIDVTFLNGVPAPGLFPKQRLKIFIYLFVQLQLGNILKSKSELVSCRFHEMSRLITFGSQ